MATPPSVFVVTTPTLEGHRIVRYIGIVAGESILGVGLGSDIVAGIKNLTGERVTEWEVEIQRARHAAITEMAARAQHWGANAVVGVAMDDEAIGSILMVAATGTAVVVESAKA
ncbi:MAG: YbjQ family protein [Methanobacteriota archaeon]